MVNKCAVCARVPALYDFIQYDGFCFSSKFDITSKSLLSPYNDIFSGLAVKNPLCRLL